MVARPKKHRPQRPRLTRPPRKSVAKDAAMAIAVAAVVVNVAVSVVIAKAVRAAKVVLRVAVKAAKVRKHAAKGVTTVAKAAPRAPSAPTVNVPTVLAVKVRALAMKLARRILARRCPKVIPTRFAQSVRPVVSARVASVAKADANAARVAVSVVRAEVKVAANARPVPRTLRPLSPPKPPQQCHRWPRRPTRLPRLFKQRWICLAPMLAQKPRVPSVLRAKKVVSVVSAARATAMAEIGVNVANVRRVKVKLQQKPAHRHQQTRLPLPAYRPPHKPALPSVQACRALVSTTCP